MRLRVNGAEREFPDGLTIRGLLEALELEGAANGRVAVEVNAEVIRKARHPEHTLEDGDEVEIVTFVGGG